MFGFSRQYVNVIQVTYCGIISMFFCKDLPVIVPGSQTFRKGPLSFSKDLFSLSTRNLSVYFVFLVPCTVIILIWSKSFRTTCKFISLYLRFFSHPPSLPMHVFFTIFHFPLILPFLLGVHSSNKYFNFFLSCGGFFTPKK